MFVVLPVRKNINTGTITDFITNNIQLDNKYRKIDVSKHIENGKFVDR